jgi:hypothetical protein
METPTHEEIESARDNARLDAQAEYEEAQRAYRDDEITDGPEHQGLCDEETDAERNR